MNFKTGALIFGTTLSMVIGVNQVLQVKSPSDVEKYRQQQTVEHGGDAVDMDHDRKRDQLPGGVDAENDRRLTPGEVRPDEPHVRLRLRP